MNDADECKRISGNSRASQAGDPHGAVSRGGSGKLRAASAVSRLFDVTEVVSAPGGKICKRS